MATAQRKIVKISTRAIKGACLCITALAASQAHAAPRSIDACTTIAKSGSYALSDDIVYGGPGNGACIKIMVSKVSINLDGHTISNGNPPSLHNDTTAIQSASDADHVAVRNGSISGFGSGVVLPGLASTVKDIHVGGPCPCQGVGIEAIGIISDNAVSVGSAPDGGVGMHVAGVIKDNYVYDTRSFGMVVDANSTVRGNTITGTVGAPGDGMVVVCPSTVAHNTITGSSGKNLVLSGEGCTVRDNTAP